MVTKIDLRQSKKRLANTRINTPAGATGEEIVDAIDSAIVLNNAGSTTDNSLVRMDSTTGKLIQGSGISVDDSNNITGVASETVQTSIVTAVSAESVSIDSATTGANATIAAPTTPIIKLTNVSLASLDGIPAGIAGQQITLINDTATTILLNNDTGGTAANRIFTGLSKPLSLKNTASVLLKYDDVLSRWRVVGGSGSGSGSGSGGGGELADLMYSAAVRDSFTDILNGTTPTDTAAGKTDAAIFDIANELMKMSYDASKTVTGTGTAMTISATPSFTIKAGDILVVNSEARRISSITSQTVVTIESAFTTNPTAAAVCISQAVHTVDLNNFNNGGLGLSAASQYSGNIDEILLGYQDSDTLNDIIPDFGTAADVAFSASTDASNWTTTRVRTTSLSESEVPVTCPTSNPNLYLRFFANKTTGSGFVNLLSYKVFFQKILGQTAGGLYYTAFARPTSSIAQNCSIGLVSGKTRFTFTFPYTRGLNSAEASGSVLEVIANGQIVPRFTSGVTDNTQAYFIEINDNTIEMDTDYTSAGIDFQFKVQRVGIIDTNTLNTTKIALHDDLLDQSLDAQVVPTFLTAVNGSPSVTQFRSDITNRASIPDLSNMLAVQMGPQRIMTQEIYQLKNEFGPAGQPVFGVFNDKFNQVRFVGTSTSTNGVVGQYILQKTNDYVEVIFYGTGLNILLAIASGTFDLRVSVDGASEGSNVWPSATSSGILNSRNYSPNVLVNVASGLSLGLHTIKIRTANDNAGGGISHNGFEILSETTSLRVAPGTIIKGKYKNSLSALQTIAFDSIFESGTLGVRGGCVLTYLKNNGTVAKAVTPTDATALFLTNASHVNEEVVRTHHFREFGAGRSDDFSTLSTTSTNRTFTLDDGTTTLFGSAVVVPTVNNNTGLGFNSTGSFITFTFVGTGLDLISNRAPQVGVFTINVSIDGGASVGNIIETNFTSNLSSQTIKICSGLPYGTHTVKLTVSGTYSTNYVTEYFVVYAPKKPVLPVGSIELAQYYNMANYVANTSQGVDFIGTGVIKKVNTREFTYVGTWAISGLGANTSTTGSNVNSSTLTNYLQMPFYGTGFEWRWIAPGAGCTYTVSVNGSTNLSGFTTSVYGTGASLVAATGVLTVTASGLNGNGVRVSGLPLGLNTVRITFTSGSSFNHDSFDIVTPIHAPTINGPYLVNDVLSLGGNNFLDLRKFNDKDVIANPSTTTSLWQKKTPGVFLGTSGAIPQLSFNNLTIGKTYRLYAQTHIYTQSNISASISYSNNGQTIVLNEYDPSDATSARRTFGSSALFIAATKTVVATVSASGGAGIETDSWVILEELPDHRSTLKWT